MSLTPYVARAAISPYVRRAVVPALSVVGFNEAARQVRTAARNVQDLAGDAQRLYHKVRMALPTPQRLFTPRRGVSSPYLRRTPLSRTPRRRAAMRRRFRAARRSPIYKRLPAPMKSLKAVTLTVPPKSASNRMGRNLSPYSFCNKLLGNVPGTEFKTKAVFFENSSWSAVPTLQLATMPLIRVPWADNESLGNRRAVGTVHLTGLKVRLKFKLNDLYSGPPMSVRWAIVVNKESVADTSVGLGNTGFFNKMEDSNAADEGQDFATNYSANRMDVQRINTDHYCIVRQGRFSLTKNAGGADVYSGGGNKQFEQYAIINQYMKFNVNVRFKLNDATGPAEYPQDNQVYFVMWAYRADKDATNTTQESNAIYVQDYLKVYWKDVGWGVGR